MLVEEKPMRVGWKVFLLFAVVFAVAFGAERIFVPDIVPIGFSDEPQPSWQVQLAFLLRAIEGTAATVALLALALTFGAWLKGLRRLTP
jgi:hypothetical protein